MSESSGSITCAVEKCLAYAAQFDSPASAACDFIALLKLSGTMSDGEVSEVARRVIDSLGAMAHQARFGDENQSAPRED